MSRVVEGDPHWLIYDDFAGIILHADIPSLHFDAALSNDVEVFAS